MMDDFSIFETFMFSRIKRQLLLGKRCEIKGSFDILVVLVTALIRMIVKVIEVRRCKINR